MSPAQEFVFYRTYSRWIDGLGRRETWNETVDRYFELFRARFGQKVPERIWSEARTRVLQMEVMPSMRALWAAGPMLKRYNILAYNCCALAFADLQSPVEMMYILMLGVGVGFSIERRYIDRMPEVKRQTGSTSAHVVEESYEGWPNSLKAGLEAWFGGRDVSFDYSNIRPRGVRLNLLGGRGSGPEPLKKLHAAVRDVVLGAQGRKLTSVEWLDIGNLIADTVVLGGAHRASQITFSDLDDEGLRHAKDFPFPPHRYMSNNSAVYFGRPDRAAFDKEWSALAKSGSGERGIFNVEAARRASPRRAASEHLRSNPCGEINLRVDHGQFCNLSEVVIRPADTPAEVAQKIRCAVWLGAMQATLTDFTFVRPSFKQICDEERLLGVSLTGQMDNPRLFASEGGLRELRGVAVEECAVACRALGINMSAAVTTGKPSGTVSQLVDCASGAHPRYARQYVRRYRIGAEDPLYKMMRDQGVPFSPENGQGPDDVERRRRELRDKGATEAAARAAVPDWHPSQVLTWVVEFPEASPPGAITRDQVTAIDQLEWYLKLKRGWCEHNQSMTVYVRDHEWQPVGEWVYAHFDEISGISFLPYDGGHYAQAPYEEISEAEYRDRVKRFVPIDYSKLVDYERDDSTQPPPPQGCSANGCELK